MKSTESSHIPPGPTRAQPPPLSSPSHASMEHLLQSVDLHSHTIITQSPQFALRFSRWWTFCGFWQLYRDVSTIVASGRMVSLRKTPLCSTHSSFPPSNPWQLLTFYSFHSFASSRKSYTWNHIVYSLFRWASFLLSFLHVFCGLIALFFFYVFLTFYCSIFNFLDSCANVSISIFFLF